MYDAIIKVTIIGNHQSTSGNPLPKPRMTRSSKWGKDERANRYFDYARWFRRQMLKMGIRFLIKPEYTQAQALEDVRKWSNNLKLNRAPFTSSPKEKWKIKISLGILGENFGDRDNIQKAILDILFTQDKFVEPNFGKIEYFPRLKNKKDQKHPYVQLELVRNSE